MNKKLFITGVIIIVLTGIGWYYRFPLEKYFEKLPQLASSPVVQQLEQDISTPPPLIGNLTGQGSNLTRAGVINWTNVNRLENGNLPPLKENSQLDAAAQVKLKDLFKQQYFEHINPQGVGPGNLAKQAGYNYITEGENLALGDFQNDQVLVTAWMNSPGHRANILNKTYQDIGVAVGQGIYQGKQTWMAVQEFGKPASSCPSVDANLKTQIDSLQNDINQLQTQINQAKQQMDSANPQTPSDYAAYNQEVANYNNLVNSYNNKVDSLKSVAEQYNAEVSAYNACSQS